jgi:hypothetical protein
MLGIRAPAAGRARPQGARAGGGLRGYRGRWDWQIVLRRCAGAARERSIRGIRGRWGLAVRAEEMCGSGKGEEHSVASGARLGTGRSYRAEAREGQQRHRRRPRQGWRGKVGRPQTEHQGSGIRPKKPGIPRALGSSGFSARELGRTPVEPSSLMPSRNSTLFAAPTPPRSAPFPPAPPHPPFYRSPCPISATPVRRNGLLTLTRYEPVPCDRGNPCARRQESAPAGRAGREVGHAGRCCRAGRRDGNRFLSTSRTLSGNICFGKDGSRLLASTPGNPYAIIGHEP